MPLLLFRVLVGSGAAVCSALLLGGCDGQQQGSGAGVSSLLAGAGQSIAAARAYDHLTRAMEDGDAFLRATSALQQNNSWHLAERLVQQRVQSARSLMDAHNLNALGYKLAENGRYPQQFVAAEAMTRRALIICDETVALLQRGADVQPEVARSLNSVRFSRANIRDSLAWSLFRQKRFLEALDEQERAVTEALSLRRRPHALSPTEINRSLVELHYHLGEIYRALRRYREARAQYQLAQKIGPKHAASAEALRTLPDSEIAPRSNTQPKTVAQRNTDWL